MINNKEIVSNLLSCSRIRTIWRYSLTTRSPGNPSHSWSSHGSGGGARVSRRLPMSAVGRQHSPRSLSFGNDRYRLHWLIVAGKLVGGEVIASASNKRSLSPRRGNWICLGRTFMSSRCSSDDATRRIDNRLAQKVKMWFFDANEAVACFESDLIRCLW